MNTLRFPITALACLALAAMQLASCASSSITPVGRTKIVAMHEFEQHSGMPIVRVPNNRIATGTYDTDSIRFECFKSDLTDAWYKSVALGRDEMWAPSYHVSGDKMVALGGASWADGDTVGLRAMLLDANTGSTLKEAVLFKQPAPEKRSKRGDFHIIESPDSTKFFVYQIKYENAIDKEKNRSIMLNGYVYSLDLAQLGFGSLSVPVPDDVDDDDLDDDAYSGGVRLDNDGNFYAIGTVIPNRVRVYQYNLKLHTSQSLDTSFDKIDLKENKHAIKSLWATFDKPGRMTLTFTRMKDKSELDAFVVAIYDFNASKVERTVAHMPAPKQLEAWFDDEELEDYTITHAFYTDEPKMLMVIAEKDRSHMETVTQTDSKGRFTGTRSYWVFDKGETILMGFTPDLKLAFQNALTKDQATVRGGADLSFVTRKLSNKVELFYVDRKEDGLFRCDVALPSGTLSQPQKIAEIGSAASLMKNQMLWDEENEAYMLFWQGSFSPTVSLYKIEM